MAAITSHGRSDLDDGASISWGTFGMTTAAGCIGGITDTFDRFMRAEGFTYRLDGDRLVLAADGVELVVLSVRPPPTTPSPTAPVSTVPTTTAPIVAPADPAHPFLPPTSIAPLTDAAIAPTVSRRGSSMRRRASAPASSTA